MSEEKGERAKVVAEVLELGEELYELALEGGEEGEGDRMEELRAAFAEFFVSLRLLLDVPR
jgi:hypothetical protein